MDLQGESLTMATRRAPPDEFAADIVAIDAEARVFSVLFTTLSQQGTMP